MYMSTVLQAGTRSLHSTSKSEYVLDWHKDCRQDNRLMVVDLAGRNGGVQSKCIIQWFECHFEDKDSPLGGYPPDQTRRHLHRRSSGL